VESLPECCRDPATYQQREELNRPAGDLQVLRAESIEAEGAEHDGDELYTY
jgi:hypothetical protein